MVRVWCVGEMYDGVGDGKDVVLHYYILSQWSLGAWICVGVLQCGSRMRVTLCVPVCLRFSQDTSHPN